MDLFAAEIGMDRAELRRRNFIAPDKFRTRTVSLGTPRRAAIYRLGQLRAGARQGAGDGQYDGMDAAKAAARTRGKYLGIGLSTYIEVCGVAPSKWISAVSGGWGAAMRDRPTSIT
jgi:carbon-monoxide dehydrogenase large subunit